MAMTSACSHDHGHQRVHADDAKDPLPRVKTKRDRYRRALTSRVDDFRAALRTTIIDNDAAHLGQRRQESDRRRANVDPADSFGFDSNPDKQAAFERWVADSLESGFLESTGQDAIRGGRHYTAQHVREAYQSGTKWADRQMREAGAPVDEPMAVDFQTGVHADELETLYLRNYSALEKITNDLDADISRTFSEALAEGVNPREAGRRLTDDINTYRNRAETMARTEFQNALSTGTANRYQEYGVQQVRILTADPCPTCVDLAGSGPYPIEQAAGLLPNRTHPNCVCSLAPVTE